MVKPKLRRQAVKVGSALSDDLQQILKYIPNGDLRISGGFFSREFLVVEALKSFESRSADLESQHVYCIEKA